MQNVFVEQIEVGVVPQRSVDKGCSISMIGTSTFDAELAKVILDDEDLGGRLLPEDLTLQIAFVDADYYWHSSVVDQDSLRQRQAQLLLLLFDLEGQAGSE